MRSFKNVAQLVGALSLVAASTLGAQTASSRAALSAKPAPQASGGGSISLGYTDIGVVVGLGGIAGADFALGGRFERIIRELPDMGDGMLGIGVGVDWYTFNTRFVNNYSWTFIPIGVTANYHFKMENRKFDPFLGAGLGYEIVTAPTLPGGYNAGTYDSGIYFIGHVGMRYFLSQAMAFYVDAGTGGGSLHAGLTWKIGGGK